VEQLSRIRDFPYKLLIFVMYGESDITYIRRQANRFIVESKPLCHRFTRKAGEIRAAFKSLENAGYIYNLSVECGRVRFYINTPKYLTYREHAAAPERYVAEDRSGEIRGGRQHGA
jgi:hypothetical protein